MQGCWSGTLCKCLGIPVVYLETRRLNLMSWLKIWTWWWSVGKSPWPVSSTILQQISETRGVHWNFTHRCLLSNHVTTPGAAQLKIFRNGWYRKVQSDKSTCCIFQEKRNTADYCLLHVTLPCHILHCFAFGFLNCNYLLNSWQISLKFAPCTYLYVIFMTDT